jgi:anthranilate phosphoribosyltransferase
VTSLAQALLQLGATRALVVHGDGYDEIAVTGSSDYALVGDGGVTIGQLDTRLFGVERHTAAALSGGDAHHNAGRLRDILAGQIDAYHDIVVVNAAAALCVADPQLGWQEAAAKARSALTSGAVADVLDRWKAFR